MSLKFPSFLKIYYRQINYYASLQYYFTQEWHANEVARLIHAPGRTLWLIYEFRFHRHEKERGARRYAKNSLSVRRVSRGHVGMRSASDTRHTERRDGCTVTARVMHSLARQRDDFGECGFNNTQIHTAAALEAAKAAKAAVEIAAAAGLGLADSRESEMGESKVRPAGESEGEERERRPHAPRLNLFLSRSHFHCVSPRSRITRPIIWWMQSHAPN